MRVPLFYLACFASAVGAYLAAVIVRILLSFANVTLFVGAIVGADPANALLGLIGNVVYSAIFAYGCAASFTTVFKRRHPEAEIPMLAVGFVASLAMTFGFPSFAASYLPAVLEWIVEQQQIIGVAAITLISALAVESAVAATGLLTENVRGDLPQAAGRANNAVLDLDSENALRLDRVNRSGCGHRGDCHDSVRHGAQRASRFRPVLARQSVHRAGTNIRPRLRLMDRDSAGARANEEPRRISWNGRGVSVSRSCHRKERA